MMIGATIAPFCKQKLEPGYSHQKEVALVGHLRDRRANSGTDSRTLTNT